VEDGVIAGTGACDCMCSACSSLVGEDAAVVAVGMQALSLVGFKGWFLCEAPPAFGTGVFVDGG
jgi:hypothetical protein